jgi:hypothetical protein
MTAREQHKVTHDRLVASLLLADTRSERHGVYPVRKPRRVKRSAWTMPTVNEKRSL